MMKHRVLLICTVLALSLCAGKKKVLDISEFEFPPKVTQTLNRILPGIVLDSATRERRKKTKIYEIEGELDEKRYLIEITEDGEILDIEEEK